MGPQDLKELVTAHAYFQTNSNDTRRGAVKKKWASFSGTGTTTKRLRTSTGNIAFEVQDLALALVYYSVRSQSEQYSPKQYSRAMVARSLCSVQPADCLYSARWGLAKATVHLASCSTINRTRMVERRKNIGERLHNCFCMADLIWVQLLRRIS